MLFEILLAYPIGAVGSYLWFDQVYFVQGENEAVRRGRVLISALFWPCIWALIAFNWIQRHVAPRRQE